MSETSWREQLSVRVSARAKRVRLSVLPPGRVEVIVPRRFDHRHLPEVIAQHAQWLERTVARVRAEYSAAASAVPQRLHLPALGRSWELAHAEAPPGRYGWREDGERLLLRHTGDWASPIRDWLAETARFELGRRLRELSARTGLGYSRLAIRCQKTRWGSCSSRGTISLNYCMLFLEPEEVDYLLVHELCHTRHMNHSSEFWGLVEHHFPGYRAVDGRLRKAGSRVPLWARKV